MNQKDNKPGKPSGPTTSQEPESSAPIIGPRNPALGEIYQRLYPEIRRPKPNQEAIAAALQAMQRLTMETDSETVSEEAALEKNVEYVACRSCGHRNRAGNKFCGACGLSLNEPSPSKDAPSAQDAVTQHSATPDLALPSRTQPSAPDDASVVPAPSKSPAGTHHYHHHYHHHYFQGQSDAVATAPRSSAPESAREADRLRIAAAAKGEPMTRGEAAVRRLAQEWVLACNTRQLDELIELYATDALVLRSNIPPIRGAMAVREFFFAALEAGLGEVALDPIRVEAFGDLGHEVGRYSALVPGTTGKRREERGKYLWVFAKQSSGDWKLISECWCSDLTLSVAESDVPKTATSAVAKIQPRRG